MNPNITITLGVTNNQNCLRVTLAPYRGIVVAD
jgi:hypothetical protein